MCRWFLRPQHVFRDFRGSARYYHMVALLGMLLVTLFAVGYVFVECGKAAYQFCRFSDIFVYLD